MKPLHEQLDAVRDEATFVAFVGALAADRRDEVEKRKVAPSSPYGSGANGWECSTIEDYLETAAHWGNTSKNGLPMYQVPENPWKRVADMLYTAKIYE
jgi:hypothetical protein